MQHPSYTLLPSAFGVLGIVWHEIGDGPRVCRVLLPHGHTAVEKMNLLRRRVDISPILRFQAVGREELADEHGQVEDKQEGA